MLDMENYQLLEYDDTIMERAGDLYKKYVRTKGSKKSEDDF